MILAMQVAIHDSAQDVTPSPTEHCSEERVVTDPAE